MISKARVNANTVHLIPTAAVWKSPEIINSLVGAACKGFLITFSLWAVWFLGNQTPLFNAELRKQQEYYESCLARFELSGDHTYDEYVEANTRCSAMAQMHKFQSRTK